MYDSSGKKALPGPGREGEERERLREPPITNWRDRGAHSANKTSRCFKRKSSSWGEKDFPGGGGKGRSLCCTWERPDGGAHEEEKVVSATSV